MTRKPASSPIPKIPNIHAAVLAAASAPDALDMAHWHTCETTHCRAGWVVHLAGDAGYALEKQYGTKVTALMIYHASEPRIYIDGVRFHDPDTDALDHI
jgi:predicted metal-dependent hydrolase